MKREKSVAGRNNEVKGDIQTAALKVVALRSIHFLHTQVGQPSYMGAGVNNNLIQSHLCFPITSISSVMNCGNGRRGCLIKIDIRYLVQFKNIATRVCSILQELTVCFSVVKIGGWPTSYVVNWQPLDQI